MTTPAISVRNLKKRYGDRPVLHDLSFDIMPGQIFALLGENGAGKTTMVKLLSTMMRPDGGSATVGGFDCVKKPWEIRRMISVTGQYATVDEKLTGRENLRMLGRLHHLGARRADARSDELLQQYDLTEAADRPVDTYSGGMRRRLDIAISLIAAPSVVFLDEPTTGLDPRSRQSMWAFIRSLAEGGVTVFLTTQYLEEADQLADTVAVIHEGRIVASGTPDELKALLANERIDFVYADGERAGEMAALLSDEGATVNGAVVSIRVKSPVSELRDKLNAMHEADNLPLEVRLLKPTLDDVFMQLTEKGER